MSITAKVLYILLAVAYGIAWWYLIDGLREKKDHQDEHEDGMPL